MTIDPGETSDALPNAGSSGASTVRWTLAGQTRSVAVRTLRHSAGTLEIESPAALSPGEVVWLIEGSAQSQCAVVGCQDIEGGHQITLRYLDAGRRREERDYTLGKGLAEWSRTDGTHDSVLATVRNLSDGGMQLLTPRPIERGSFVRLKGEQFECQGFVRYCTAGEDGEFRIGLQFSQTPYDRHGLDYQD